MASLTEQVEHPGEIITLTTDIYGALKTLGDRMELLKKRLSPILCDLAQPAGDESKLGVEKAPYMSSSLSRMLLEDHNAIVFLIQECDQLMDDIRL